MNREEYIAKCVRNGDTEENAANTWELMAAIQRILDDEDADPYAAPESVPQKKVRLARLFIDRYQELGRNGDKAFAAWLRSKKTAASIALASDVERQEHWKWWHEIGKRA